MVSMLSFVPLSNTGVPGLDFANIFSKKSLSLVVCHLSYGMKLNVYSSKVVFTKGYQMPYQYNHHLLAEQCLKYN